VVETKSAPFVRLNERVDTVYEFVRQKWWKGGGLLAELRRQKFDLVLDLQRHFKSGIFSISTGSPRRLGVNPRNAKEFNWLFNNHHCEFVPDTVSKMVLYGAFLKELGIEEGLDQLGGFRREQFLPNTPDTVLNELRANPKTQLVGVVMGSTWPTKDLPAQGIERVVRGLLSYTFNLSKDGVSREGDGFTVLLLGDKTQANLGEKIAASFDAGARVINLAGRTNLAQLMGVLASCSAVVGPDSGPAHLSSLVGTPHVTIFGPTDPRRVAPLGSEKFSIVPTVGCAPCWRRSCPGLDNICMRLHSPDEIVSQVLVAIEAKRELSGAAC
jgi:ADP-heptose:LPS heptosyltransferase